MANHSEDLVDALSQFVRAEAGGPAPAKPTEFDPTRALTLLAFALNCAFILSLGQRYFQSAFIDLLTKIVPFVFGAYFIASMDHARETLRTWCGKRWFRIAMAGAFAVLLPLQVVNVIPVTLPVRTSAPQVQVWSNGILQPSPGRGHALDLPLSFQRQTFVVEDRTIPGGPLADTILIPWWERLRASKAARALLGEDTLDLSNTYPVAITLDNRPRGPRPQLEIRGRFPDWFVRQFRGDYDELSRTRRPTQRLSWLTMRDSVVLWSPLTTSDLQWVRLPPGRYVTSYREGECRLPPVPLLVHRDSITEEQSPGVAFDPAQCPSP